MATPRVPSSRRPRPAVALTAFAVLMLVAVPFCGAKLGSVDFPCSAMPMVSVTSETRIAYCVDQWPRNFYGGGFYAAGAVSEDTLSLPADGILRSGLTLQRRGSAITANGMPIGEGQTYSESHSALSLNPWLLVTTRFTISSYGPEAPFPVMVESVPTNAIYLFGEVREGWLPGPLGPIMLIIGIALWVIKARPAPRRV
jgi:hypothetical protein